MAAPTVTTDDASSIAATSATLGGEATQTTNAIIHTGVVYKTSSGIGLADVVIQDTDSKVLLAPDNTILELS